MGRLPKRSLIAPQKGENRNCIKEKMAINKPILMGLAENSLAKYGIKGRIIPKPTRSKNTVKKYNFKGAFLLFGHTVKLPVSRKISKASLFTTPR